MTSFIHKKISFEYLEKLNAKENIFVSDNDIPGLRLRYYAKTKTKVFYFWFRTKNTKKSYNIRIGQYPEVKLMEARDIATEFRTMVRRGDNPVEQQRLKEKKFQAEEEKRIKFNIVLQRYLDEYALVYKKLKTYKTDISTSKNYLFPKLGNLYINEIDIKDINSLVAEVGKKSKSQANKCKALLSHFLNWCEDMKIRELNSNPCRRVRKFKIESRDRVLSIEEYLRFFAACDKGEKLGRYSPYVFKLFKFLAFSACRPSEVRLLTFAEVDFDYSMLRLKDSKTGKKTVPLGKEALDILRGLYNELYKGNLEDYVFPASIRKGTPLLDLRRPWDYVRNEAKLKNVSPYTLRHSFATFATTIGENTAVLKQILGHSNITTTEHYIHSNDVAGVNSANAITGALSAVLTQGSHKSGEFIKKVSTKKKDILRTGKLTIEYIELYLNQRLKANESLDKVLMQYEFYKKYLKSDSRITFLEVVDKGDIESVYNRIKDISPVDADECILALYNFFDWCELNGYREKNTNPCSDIKENISYSINKNSVIYTRKTQNEYSAA